MITSRQNPLVKFIKSLSDKKARDEYGVFIVEGVKNVKEALASGYKINLIVGTEKGLCGIDIASVKTEIFSDDVFKSVSGEVTPQGALAVVEKPKCLPSEKTCDCIFLDGVSDPANVGAIIRTAAACGFTDIYIAGGADAYSPKSVRASMGGIFRVRIYTGDRESLADSVKVPFVIADMNGKNAFTFVKTENVCLVIGNEGNGVSEYMKAKAKYTLSIPMQNGMESLNAGVAAGILMYQLKK